MAETGSDTTKSAPTARPSRAKAGPAKVKAPAKPVSTKPDSAAAGKQPASAPAPAVTEKRVEAASSRTPAKTTSAAKSGPAAAKSATAASSEATSDESASPKRAASKSTTASQRKLKAQIAKVVPQRAAGAGRPARAATRRAVSPIATSIAEMRRVTKTEPADKPAAVVDAVTKSSVEAAEAVSSTVAASVDAAVKTVKDAKAKPSLSSAAMPQPPEFALLTGSAMMTQTLSMARAFGTLQAKMLDHACAEFGATLSEAETLSKTVSASDAVALQAKAVRRSFQSYADHLKELARIASELTKKG